MGQHPDGILSYGVHITAWEEQSSPEEIGDDWDEWLLKIQTGKTDADFEDRDEYRAFKREAEKQPNYITIETLYSWDYPIWTIVISESIVRASEGGPVELKPLAPEPVAAWEEALKKFFEAANIEGLEFTQGHWLLGASYG